MHFHSQLVTSVRVIASVYSNIVNINKQVWFQLQNTISASLYNLPNFPQELTLSANNNYNISLNPLLEDIFCWNLWHKPGIFKLFWLRVARSFVFCVMFCRSCVMFCRSLFVRFHLPIVLYVLLWFTASDYSFAIIKLCEVLFFFIFFQICSAHTLNIILAVKSKYWYYVTFRVVLVSGST